MEQVVQLVGADLEFGSNSRSHPWLWGHVAGLPAHDRGAVHVQPLGKRFLCEAHGLAPLGKSRPPACHDLTPKFLL